MHKDKVNIIFCFEVIADILRVLTKRMQEFGIVEQNED